MHHLKTTRGGFKPAPAGRGNSFIQSPVVTQTLQSTPTTQVFSSTIPPTTPELASVPVSAVSDRPVRQTKPNPKYKDYVGPQNTTSHGAKNQSGIFGTLFNTKKSTKPNLRSKS